MTNKFFFFLFFDPNLVIFPNFARQTMKNAIINFFFAVSLFLCYIVSKKTITIWILEMTFKPPTPKGKQLANIFL